ncbi:hypothetical protein [Streptomyces spiramenti]|uniref:Uncharacterized protein n=1 Tax=Streptomyces spiramenti TaxID=2720606 RepID=A0ABX1AM15_9ACTN|nr:hypothetical protein [Streptomyces spiramenti]NJP68152.1 hypothetical protein [Streptomyces spiramenti]
MDAPHETHSCPVCREPWLVLADPTGLPDRMAELSAAAERFDGEAASRRAADPAVVPRPGAHPGDERDEHDAFFGVARATDLSAGAFLLGGAHTHHVLAVHRARCGCGDPRDLDVLMSGWRCLRDHASGATGVATCPDDTADDDADLVDCPRPHEHWRVGHQVFFVLIQGVVTGLRCFVSATGAGDARTASRALGLAAEMCRHSAVAMKFAGGLSLAEYEREVRPSMLPPAVRPGFSGFQTRDHALLVRTLRATRPALASLGFHHPAVTALERALQRVYAAHRLVCSRFDGTRVPSLLMEATGPETARRAGVEVVDELTERRLALVREAAARSDRR